MKRREMIGIGVVTFNRIDMFQKCIAAVPESDALVVVNDGGPYPASVYPARVAEVIQHDRNRGVGRSKNDALHWLLDAGCTDIFLIEDDIRVLDPLVCHKYMQASRRTGIKHFNFAYHGFENKLPNGEPTPPRKIVRYSDDTTVSLHRHILGAFQYFTDDVLQQCGLMDPMFVNMIEHVEHTYRIIKHGYHPPFWWFADLHESYKLIQDLDPYHEHSTVRSKKLSYRVRMRLSELYFALKHGRHLMRIKDSSDAEVNESLASIEKKFGYQKEE